MKLWPGQAGKAMEKAESSGSRGLSSCILKVIACISMLIDHATYAFIPETDPNGWMGVSVPYLIGRCLGRSAFVIFSFLLVEGFHKTGDRRKYALRILICAIISEPVFDNLCGTLNASEFLVHQNVLFSFVLGILCMILLEMVRERFGYSFDTYSRVKYNLSAAFICLAGFLSAYYLRLDHGGIGLGLVFLFYFLKGTEKWKLVLAIFAWSIACFFFDQYLEWAGILAAIPICLYSGERGRISKWFFYIFYPTHMLVLWILHVLVLSSR